MIADFVSKMTYSGPNDGTGEVFEPKDPRFTITVNPKTRVRDGDYVS